MSGYRQGVETSHVSQISSKNKMWQLEVKLGQTKQVEKIEGISFFEAREKVVIKYKVARDAVRSLGYVEL